MGAQKVIVGVAAWTKGCSGDSHGIGAREDVLEWGVGVDLRAGALGGRAGGRTNVSRKRRQVWSGLAAPWTTQRDLWSVGARREGVGRASGSLSVDYGGRSEGGQRGFGAVRAPGRGRPSRSTAARSRAVRREAADLGSSRCARKVLGPERAALWLLATSKN